MYEGRIPQGWISCFPGASFLPSLPFFSTTGREQPCPIRNRRCRGYHWASCQIPQGDFIAIVEMPLQTSILLMRSAKTRHGFPLWRLPSITLKTAIYCKKNDFFVPRRELSHLPPFGGRRLFPCRKTHGTFKRKRILPMRKLRAKLQTYFEKQGNRSNNNALTA